MQGAYERTEGTAEASGVTGSTRLDVSTSRLITSRREAARRRATGRALLVHGLALLAACRSHDAPRDPPRATARFVGDYGAPGPEVLAFCREPQLVKEVRQLAPGVTVERILPFPDSPRSSCLLRISARDYRDEVGRVLHFSLHHYNFGLDVNNELTVHVDDSENETIVTWSPYVALDTLLGTEGRLLVGFDVTRVLGKPAMALHDAISSPFTIDKTSCDRDRCVAYGPSLPGGEAVKISTNDSSKLVEVRLETIEHLQPYVSSLIAATLGLGRQAPKDGADGTLVHVYVKDGVRYQVTTNYYGHRAATVVQIDFNAGQK